MAYHSFLDPDGKHLGFKEKMVEKEKSSTTLTLNWDVGLQHWNVH